MPQNWTGGDNWSLSSIHSSFWWPLLTSSPGRWSVKVTAKPSLFLSHKPLRLQTVAVPSASHRDWGHTAINFHASLSLGHQTPQSHRGSKHLPTWNTCSKSDEQPWVRRLLLSAFSNVLSLHFSPERCAGRTGGDMWSRPECRPGTDGDQVSLRWHFLCPGFESLSFSGIRSPKPWTPWECRRGDAPATSALSGGAGGGGGLALPPLLSLPEHLARSAPADCAWEVSPLPLSSQERGSSADGGTRTRTWTTLLVSGSRAGWLRPFSHVHLSQQKAPHVVVPGPSPLLHKVAHFQVSQVLWV